MKHIKKIKNMFPYGRLEKNIFHTGTNINDWFIEIMIENFYETTNTNSKNWEITVDENKEILIKETK